MADPAVVQAIAQEILDSNKNISRIFSVWDFTPAVEYAIDHGGLSGPDIVSIASQSGNTRSSIDAAVRSTADARADYNKGVATQKAELEGKQKAGLSLTDSEKAALSQASSAGQTSGLTPSDAIPSGSSNKVNDPTNRFVPVPGDPTRIWLVDKDGNIVPDNSGKPIFGGMDSGEAGANSRAAMQEAGANSRNAATIAANKALADETNRIAEDQFDRKFKRDQFTSDRDFAQARDQFIATFKQSENQFGASQAGLDRRAAMAEQGVNDRFGAQYAMDAANAQNTYGLTATGQENQYNTTRFSALSQDQLGRYNAETGRQARLSELATQRERDTRDILSKPSDALARLFFQRGGTSPVAFTSQSDLIDRLNAQIKGAIPKELPAPIDFPTYKAPPVYITPAPYVPRPIVPGAPYVPTPPPGGGGAPAPVAAPVNTGSSGPNGSAGGSLSVNAAGQAVWTATPAAAANAAAASSGESRAQGGLTHAPVMRVGDNPNGQPNDTEETIINPTNAPIGVIPNPATVSKLSSKQGMDQNNEEMMTTKKMDGLRKAMQHVDNPALLHGLVDELAGHQSKLSPPKYAQGTGADVNTTQGQGDYGKILSEYEYRDGMEDARNGAAPKIQRAPQNYAEQQYLQGYQAGTYTPADKQLDQGSAIPQLIPRYAQGTEDLSKYVALLQGGARSSDVNALLNMAIQQQLAPRPVQTVVDSAPAVYPPPVAAPTQSYPVTAPQPGLSPVTRPAPQATNTPSPTSNGGSWNQEDASLPAEGWSPQTGGGTTSSRKPLGGNSTPLDLVRALFENGPSLGLSKDEIDKQNNDSLKRIVEGAMLYPGTGGAISSAASGLKGLAGLLKNPRTRVLMSEFDNMPAEIIDNFDNLTGTSPKAISDFVKNALPAASKAVRSATEEQLGKAFAKKMPAYAQGTWEIPRYYLGTLDLNNLNGIDTPTDQNALLADARASTSPGGQALLSDLPGDNLRFGGGLEGEAALPSAIRYGRLTKAEKENLNTTLAARYNTDLQDLTDQLDQRYGGSRTRAQARLTIR